MAQVHNLGGPRIAVRQGLTLTYLHADALGSASLATTVTGTLVSQLRYLPYGETRPDFAASAFPTDRRFTGQREEVTLGLYDYKARFYSPSLGRFLSPDTIVPGPGGSQGWNRYSYTTNNPLRYTDPTGHCHMPGECVYDGSGGSWVSTLPYQGINGTSIGNRQTALNDLKTGTDLVAAHGGNALTLALSGEAIENVTGAAQQVSLHVSSKSPHILRINAPQTAREVLNLTSRPKLNLGTAADAQEVLEATVAGRMGVSTARLYGGVGRFIGNSVVSFGTVFGLAASAGCDIYTYATGGYDDRFEFVGALTVDTAINLGAAVIGGVATGIAVTAGAPIIATAVVGIVAGTGVLLAYNYVARNADIERVGGWYRESFSP